MATNQTGTSPSPRRRPYQSFLSAVILTMVLPAVPVLFGRWTNEDERTKALLLFASFYLLSIGASSHHPAIFAIASLGALADMMALLTVSDPQLADKLNRTSDAPAFISFGTSGHTTTILLSGLFAVVVLHLVERYIRHVRQGEKFPDFW